MFRSVFNFMSDSCFNCRFNYLFFEYCIVGRAENGRATTDDKRRRTTDNGRRRTDHDGRRKTTDDYGRLINDGRTTTDDHGRR